ncbi:hypothetical protein AAFF_G00100740 [Aldrovandia affinis]|uniref:Uncharacterized protein n=1 Tax=Aldrovandia affinis TaxID=143900 RepID=A0AAD7RUM2_9TELE|nr:hypothetical protein AAFF_G00100740 [Aldrovandia affinis]
MDMCHVCGRINAEEMQHEPPNPEGARPGYGMPPSPEHTHRTQSRRSPPGMFSLIGQTEVTHTAKGASPVTQAADPQHTAVGMNRHLSTPVHTVTAIANNEV